MYVRLRKARRADFSPGHPAAPLANARRVSWKLQLYLHSGARRGLITQAAAAPRFNVFTHFIWIRLSRIGSINHPNTARRGDRGAAAATLALYVLPLATLA